MKSTRLVSIFLRSLLIQASFNFWRMQNLGFVYALIPLIRLLGNDQGRMQDLLLRHLQLFNSHPYMTGPILGSVVHIEEDNLKKKALQNEDARTLKNALCGPYAAIGDSFFWGAYRPLSAFTGVLLAVEEYAAAPLITFCMYNSVSLWVRWRGFTEGYRLGKLGIDFVRRLDLPEKTKKIRWISLSILALLAVLLSSKESVAVLVPYGRIGMRIGGLFCILLCLWAVKKGISPVHILYGMAGIIFLLCTVK
ncbi:PTS system, mannose-specific IID component [Syntrophus gentianae]|uniref:PTS system, mannose-specific IID component n=1 Tax=Syntrophus gentianae TaxID=43775 RepID=A0A1H7X4Z4_9BACT|nr:PTS system mannose/fructose/sorbose family transporter subunit IID [Syntrophus gentianae]SEM28675.1 PTS system, mannose-specific IID component [Syntrophus gentianae]